MKKIFFYMVLFSLILTSPGCKKSLLDLPNKSANTFDTYFKSDDEMNQAVIATYATLLHEGMWSRDYYYMFDLLGYEAKPDDALDADLLILSQYRFGPDQYQVQQFWASLYRMVLRANVVINRANVWEPKTSQEQENKKQYIAEAKFLKSYANFNLVTCYGRVPLRTSYDSTINNFYPSRASTEAVWNAIEQDLTEAIADLPVSYSSEYLGRATKGAAIALLGKAHLYQGEWADAQIQFEQLTQAPFDYSLATNYSDLFSTENQDNPETIFQVMHQEWTDWAIGNQYYFFGGQEAWGQKATHTARAQEYGFNDWKNVFITTATVNAFTYPSPVDGSPYTDPRAAFTFYGDAPSGSETEYCQECSGGPIPFDFTGANGGYRWLKYEYYYKVETCDGPQSGINSQVIRYADVKLMLAEAYIQQGNTGSIPLGLINDVRNRSGALPYATLGSVQNAMQIIMRERQLELCGEQSRYFDLIRWGIAKDSINSIRLIEDGTQPFQDKHVLLPIPLDEKSANPNVANDIHDNWN